MTAPQHDEVHTFLFVVERDFQLIIQIVYTTPRKGAPEISGISYRETGRAGMSQVLAHNLPCLIMANNLLSINNVHY